MKALIARQAFGAHQKGGIIHDTEAMDAILKSNDRAHVHVINIPAVKTGEAKPIKPADDGAQGKK